MTFQSDHQNANFKLVTRQTVQIGHHHFVRNTLYIMYMHTSSALLSLQRLPRRIHWTQTPKQREPKTLLLQLTHIAVTRLQVLGHNHNCYTAYQRQFEFLTVQTIQCFQEKRQFCHVWTVFSLEENDTVYLKLTQQPIDQGATPYSLPVVIDLDNM